jgi:hypothetical protein
MNPGTAARLPHLSSHEAVWMFSPRHELPVKLERLTPPQPDRG